MSNREELKSLVDAGKQLSGSGGQGIISRVKIEFGFHRYVNGHDFWSFWKPANTQNELASVKDELMGRLQKAGCNDQPNFGVKVTIDKNVFSRDEPYKANLQEFVPEWQSDAFDLIYDSIDEVLFPIGEWFYGRVEYKANPFHVKKGEAGKTDTDQDGNPRFPSLRVPVEIFANAADAQAAVPADSGIDTDNSGWSEKAVASYGPDMTSLMNQTDEILKYLDEAKNGKPFNNDAENFPLPQKPTPPTPVNLEKYNEELAKYIADIYAIEATDLDKLIPF